MSDERLARARWGGVAEPGDRMAHTLIETLGAVDALDLVATHPDPDDVLVELRRGGYPVADDDDLLRELTRALARWCSRVDAAKTRDALGAGEPSGARFIIPDDAEWPRQLNDLGEHAPIGLWVLGDAAALQTPGIAMVGSRKSSDYGIHCATELTAGLVSHGLSIISGAAFGIDKVAHRTALLTGGTTVAFLAGGVDRPYPKDHEGLLQEITRHGAVVSEMPCDGQPSKWRFLQRNRLIAAQAAATIVVEAGWRSGALNTAAHASTVGRPYAAVPGPITGALSAGCHRLLRERSAICVTSADEIIELAGFGGPLELPLDWRDPRETRVLDALSSRRRRGPREIAERSGLPLDEVRATLGVLELAGAVDVTADGWRFMGRR